MKLAFVHPDVPEGECLVMTLNKITRSQFISCVKDSGGSLVLPLEAVPMDAAKWGDVEWDLPSNIALADNTVYAIAGVSAVGSLQAQVSGIQLFANRVL